VAPGDAGSVIAIAISAVVVISTTVVVVVANLRRR
jgi:hypothetical protein